MMSRIHCDMRVYVRVTAKDSKEEKIRASEKDKGYKRKEIMGHQCA